MKSDLYPVATAFVSPPAAQFDPLTAGQPKRGFVDESSRLQDGIRASAPQCRPAKAPELFVRHGHELPESGLVSGSPTKEQLVNIGLQVLF